MPNYIYRGFSKIPTSSEPNDLKIFASKLNMSFASGMYKKVG